MGAIPRPTIERVRKRRRHMDKFFKISERGSSVRTEIVGGITTFFAMAYIIFVNPNTLCADLGGGDRKSVV